MMRAVMLESPLLKKGEKAHPERCLYGLAFFVGAEA